MELQFDVSEENKKEQSIPSAPLEPNIEIRTMKSDIAALKESGGDITNITAIENAPPATRDFSSAQPAISDKPIFVENQDIGGNNSSALKMMVIIIGVLILAAGIGFASYYLVAKVL